MTDGSGSTSWIYDLRGRVTQETKTISGAGSFVTQWGYNSGDLVSWMKYPANNSSGVGEQVTFDYYRQMSLNSLYSNTHDYYYVPLTGYDAAGRVDLRWLGAPDQASAPVLVNDYSYYSWTTQNGRLLYLKSGLYGNSDSLQSFEYSYDEVGNVAWIKDYNTGLTTQTQTFSYDGLNRLQDAAASGGTGGLYSENYDYADDTGNLWKKGATGSEGVYTYATTYDTGRPHAVKQVIGSGGNSKTVTVRAYSTACNDGIRATMELWVNGVKRATWTNVASSWTAYSQSVTLSGNDMIEVVFTNDCNAGGYDRNLYVDYVVVDGTTIQAEGGAALIDKGSGSAAFDWQNMIVGQQTLAWNAALRLVKGPNAFAGSYDANGNLIYRIAEGSGTILSYDAENRLTGVQSSLRTDTFGYDGDGARVKSVVNNVTTAFVGNYVEWNVGAGTMKKYYYAGGAQIAMRDNGTLYWLLGDHLGSTSKVANSNGTQQSEQRYRAWGETRFTSGTLPTKFTYTGQYSYVSDFGLHFYNARWYDSSLGRFAQADTVTPGGVQGLDRYAGMANNPVRYTDPTGHNPECGPDGVYCDNDELNDYDYQPDPVTLSEDNFSCAEGGGCYDGQDMYDLYQEYVKETDSWWYDVFGEGGFSIAEFFILILYFEMAGAVDDDVAGQQAYSWAISEKLSYWCAEYSGGACSGASNNAMLNYLATRGTAMMAYDAYVTGDAPMGITQGGKIINDKNWSLGIANDIILDTLKSVSPLGSQADFGNNTMFPDENGVAMASAPIGMGPNNVVWRSIDNIAYVMTADQITYWNTIR